MKVTIHLLQVDEKGESFSIILVFKVNSSISITNTQEVLKSITANKLMNINSGNIGELAGNQSILDKKERKHFKGIVFKRKYKGVDSIFSFNA